MSELRERLAELEHKQWTHWTEYFLENFREIKNRLKWKKQTKTPYSELSEEEKKSDREWADKVLELLKKEEIK